MEETIYEYLSAFRKKKRKRLSAASKILCVKLRYLEMLEEGKYAELSRETYVMGLMQSYMRWLGIEDELLIHKAKKEVELATERSSHALHLRQVAFHSYQDMAQAKLSWLLASCLLMLVCWGVFHVIQANSQENMRGYVVAREHKPIIHKESFIFMARDDVEFTLLSQQGDDKKRFLASGEMYFLEKDKDHTVHIASATPSEIDVFKGEQADEYLGSLDQVSFVKLVENRND